MKKILLLISLIYLTFISLISIIVFANDTNKYTDVLSDLQKDITFNVENYNSYTMDEVNTLNNDFDENNDIKLLNIIQIAESIDNELFIYVYNPTATDYEILASTINLSLKDGTELEVHKYDLTLLNNTGVFYKYIVNDLIIDKNNGIRTYNIIEINRWFDKEIDKEPTDDNTINEKSIGVAQRWVATTYETGVEYEMSYIKTIVFTNQHAGTIRLAKGWYLNTVAKVDGHYLAFSTDRLIEDLIEVDIEFNLRYFYSDILNNVPISYIDKTTEEFRRIKNDDVGGSTGGWFADSHSWKRIQTIDQFKTSCENDGVTLTEETLSAIKDCKWVLRFMETDYTIFTQVGNDALGIQPRNTREYYQTSNIDVLRLKYQTEGIVYNLGVVADTISGDNIPDGENKFELDLSNLEETFEKILMLISILILIVMFGFISPIITPILTTIINLTISIISIPFKILNNLIKPKRRK